MKIFRRITDLVNFAERNLGLNKADEAYAINGILDVLNLSTFEQSSDNAEYAYSCDDIHTLLEAFCQTAVEEGVFEHGFETYYCDKIMGALSLLPSDVDREFQSIKSSRGGESAMRWLYDYCVNNNYVKKAVLDRNPRFDAENGLVVTINLAKPEFRDPKKAAGGNSVKGGYPKCVICRENEGLAFRNKCTLRTVSLVLGGKPWFWQYSPYGYFHQHGIAVNTVHIPMHVDRQTIVNLMDFVDQFPCYFIGCNAALERIGGSVLGHDHYQGGGEILPLHKATVKNYFTCAEAPDLKIGVLDWPGSVVRIVGENRDQILDIADKIRVAWENFSDPAQQILCRTERGQHNAVSPTVVRKGNCYEVSIILRSNVTSEKFPDGIFHAHPEFHVIKKESIGLIEAQGLFILPGRLVTQLGEMERCILHNATLPQELADFAMIRAETEALLGGIDGNAQNLSADAVHEAVKRELASVCYRILQNTAVFKTEELFAAFLEGAGFDRA